MTLVDLLIIYLSIGAPFGVLAFFGQSWSSRRPIAVRTAIAVAFWPILLATRLHKRFSEALADTKNTKSEDFDAETQNIADQIKRSLNAAQQTILDDYITLTVARNRVQTSPEDGYEEFLNLAGNANASLGSVCLTRRRNKQVLERQIQSQRELIRLFDEENHQGFIRSEIALLCGRLGDPETARNIRLSNQEIKIPAAAKQDYLVTSA